MAKASTFTRKITRKVVENVPGYVELNLTPEEASFLRGLLYYHVGGHPDRTKRRYAVSIQSALHDAEVAIPDQFAGGAVYCKEGE